MQIVHSWLLDLSDLWDGKKLFNDFGKSDSVDFCTPSVLACWEFGTEANLDPRWLGALSILAFLQSSHCS